MDGTEADFGGCSEVVREIGELIGWEWEWDWEEKVEGKVDSTFERGRRMCE